MHRHAWALGLLACANACAAPLDALLTARPRTEAGWPAVEVGWDMANRKVDVLGLRPKKADGSYGPSGDYSGGHLRLGINVLPALWLDGGLWSRRFSYVSTSADVTSWQLAAQYKALDSGPAGAALALRGGVWGDTAPALRKTTSAVVQGITFTSATATRPHDLQLQLDVVGSWALTNEFELSGFVGGGRSKVDFDEVTATSQSKGGCAYDIQFTATHVIASCDSKGVQSRVAVPNAVYGIDVNQEARYTASYASAGLNGVWRPGAWRLRAGLQTTVVDRGAVDDIVVGRRGTAYKSNTVFVADLGYSVWPGILVFTRAQILAHQFVGEAPLTYNTLTATQHRRRYGILTLGLSSGF